MEKENLATELLRDSKLNAKRWFIAFCIMAALETATITGFLWYISLPIEEDVTTTQTVEGDDNTDVKQIGGDYNESDAN